MTLSIARARHYLKTFALETLFIDELGWDHHATRLSVQVGEDNYTLEGIAEKRGVQIFRCQPGLDGKIPDYATRQKIEKQVTKSAYEHLIIFINADQTIQIWQWVSRQPGQPAAYREHPYHAEHHSGVSLIQKLEAITFTINEEEGLTLTGVVFRLHDAFDRDRVTKRFYDLFKKEHKVFLDFIQGITEQGDREWYASLMLNRLMFVYFIQRKGFLDGDRDYLKNRLQMVQERKGKGKFLSFYRYFLIRLFHEGFSQQPAQRATDLEELLGKVPYLNGGLFELHELEQKHSEIDIPDEAFERLFDFFDQYEWTLDTRPLRNDREINPDVLGYIFEKFINQKQMGAYYTKEDITEYISKNTIIPYLFDAAEKKCAIAFQPDSALWQLLSSDPDRYIYPAVRKGVVDASGHIILLPAEIEKGISSVKDRGNWNSPADPEYALPTEIWREHVARRQRCLEIREKMSKGEIHEINDLITYNLDIRQFAQDVITNCEGPELLRAFYKAISTVTILDPTCGSGAFLFAALNILELLYEACLDRMQAFLEDLERSGERHSPEKFSDFRRTLAEIEKHPNRPYFIFKSIIVNNLYGVDIMQEAVEICKLRLFLKLVAQVDKVKDLEPLPDIDFNIRAGNTLVGFATLEDVQRTLDGRLGFKKNQVDQISEEAEFFVDRAYRRFHEMQTAHDMDATDFANTKQELRSRLGHLTEQLDRYLATEYGISESIIQDKIKYNEAFLQWHDSHQPFHWFAEFYGIMNTGGFNVIIGNPPYIEYSKVRKIYTLKDFFTESCRNLYAYVLEQSTKIHHKTGAIGYIVPISLVCTQRMEKLQDLLEKCSSQIWISNYAERPSKLFEGSEVLLTIFLSRGQQKVIPCNVLSTGFIKWSKPERLSLFQNIRYSLLSNKIKPFIFPKLSTDVESSILQKIVGNGKTLGNSMRRNSPYSIFYRIGGGRYWKIFTNFQPRFILEGIESVSSRENYLYFESPLLRDVAISILSSTLFYWYFILTTNCRDLNPIDLRGFPIDLEEVINFNGDKLQNLTNDLMENYKANSESKEKNSSLTGNIIYQEFYPRFAKEILDQIDIVLAKHFGFTKEEEDYILNFDIKYRLGQAL